MSSAGRSGWCMRRVECATCIFHARILPSYVSAPVFQMLRPFVRLSHALDHLTSSPKKSRQVPREEQCIGDPTQGSKRRFEVESVADKSLASALREVVVMVESVK